MVTFEITLPEDVKASAEARARLAGYSDLSEYLAALLRTAPGVPIDAETEAKLLEGLDSAGRLVTRADWDEKIRRFEERMKAQGR
jgi:hypothetical protein